MIHTHYETASLNDPASAALTCDGLTGTLECLDWDSKVLGVRSARLRALFFEDPEVAQKKLAPWLDQFQKWRKSNQVRFVDFRFKSNWKSLLSDVFLKAGFYLADELVIYRNPIQKKEVSPSVKKIGPKEAKGFFELHPNLFLHGRIASDSHFSKKQAQDFYRELFLTVSSKSEAISVGLFNQEKLCGIALGFPNASNAKQGCLWQIATFPQGQGYGKVLFEGFVSHMAQKFEELEIGTQQENKAARRLYESCGFSVAEQITTLHFFE